MQLNSYHLLKKKSLNFISNRFLSFDHVTLNMPYVDDIEVLEIKFARS
jgi:hypothetical protein